MNSTVPECGYFQASYRPGAVLASQGSQLNQYFMECGSEESAGTGTSTAVDARAQVDGNKIVIWAPVAAFPKEVLASGQLTEISVQSQVADPMFGIMGNGLVVPTDDAATDKSWRFA